MAALRQLPRDQQVALVLVDMLEYGVADAAAILGVAEGTVKSRCARGRARLLPRLGHLRQTVGAPGGAASPGGAGGAARAQSTLTETSVESEQGQRNQIPPGSVLPAREGGDEEE
jgi:RNA polymerase sigma-70 factor (ECF subfamily)